MQCPTNKTSGFPPAGEVIFSMLHSSVARINCALIKTFKIKYFGVFAGSKYYQNEERSKTNPLVYG
jgi:hypothetical protein